MTTSPFHPEHPPREVYVVQWLRSLDGPVWCDYSAHPCTPEGLEAARVAHSKLVKPGRVIFRWEAEVA
jgi:hypothetical protein